MKKSPVFFAILGMMLLIIGFNGLMAHRFSKNAQRMEGVEVIDFSQIDEYTKRNHNFCITGEIFSDDAFFMPDDKSRKVIKGSLQLVALWPDNTQNVLIDYERQAQYLKFSDQKQNSCSISPQLIETATDTVGLTSKLKVRDLGKFLNISYFGYKFSIPEFKAKGMPQIKLIRKTFLNGEKSVVFFNPHTENGRIQGMPAVSKIAPEKVSVSKQNFSTESKIYTVIIVLGGLMLLIPKLL